MPEFNPLPSGHTIFGQQIPQKQVEKQSVRPSLKKQKTKAIVVLGLSVMALLSYSIFYFYKHAAAYLQAPSEIEQLQNEVERYDQTVIPQLEAEKNTHKAAYDQEFNEAINALNTVFPEAIDKRSIVQLLESFATEVALVTPPFEFTAINFEKPIQADGYTVIPISTTIHSSQIGFERFLTLVERSGMIYEDPEAENKVFLDQMIRLMSISNISLKYRGVDEETGRDGGVDFSVKLDFYSRNSTL